AMWPCGHSVGANVALQAFDRDKRPPSGIAKASPSAGLPEVRGGCLVPKSRRFKTPRGLTSNRHAGRPDRQTVRAFAFHTGLLTNFMAPLRWRNERALPIFNAP